MTVGRTAAAFMHACRKDTIERGDSRSSRAFARPRIDLKLDERTRA